MFIILKWMQRLQVYGFQMIEFYYRSSLWKVFLGEALSFLWKRATADFVRDSDGRLFFAWSWIIIFFTHIMTNFYHPPRAHPGLKCTYFFIQQSSIFRRIVQALWKASFASRKGIKSTPQLIGKWKVEIIFNFKL